jgi:hypothetical protein
LVRAQKTWVANARSKLDEKLAALERCAPNGAWAGEERFFQSLKFAADGSVAELRSIQTSMQTCAAAECIAKELSGVGVDPPAAEIDSEVGFYVIVQPNLPPRQPSTKEGKFFATGPKQCRPDADAKRKHGRLPPEVIQEIVRSNYGAFRSCYEEGLGRTRTLAGRVDVRFVIERDGSVGKAIISDNTLPDCKVSECVRSKYPTFKFPAPDG